MTDAIANIGVATDSAQSQNARAPTQPAARSAAPQSNSPDPADLRLVIEEDRAAGCFVYKTVDWRTGAVVQQLPREQIVKFREAQNYSAGDVIISKA